MGLVTTNLEMGLSATIFLTDRCNLACSYCYEPDKQFKSVSWDDIKAFIHMLYDTPRYSQFKRINLDFIGGEPLLEPKMMMRAMTYFYAEGRRRGHHWTNDCRNITFFATTNGTMFDDPDVQEMIRAYPIILGLSLDGDKESHDRNRKYLDGRGSYDKIMEHFQWWRDKYKQGMCKGTLSHNNLTSLCTMLSHQVSLGLKPWANPTFDEIWTKEDAEEYGRQIRSFIDHISSTYPDSLMIDIRTIHTKKLDTPRNEGEWCGTGRYMVSMGLDGMLYPCHRFSTNTHKYPIGNIRDGLDEAALDRLLESFSGFRCSDCSQVGGCPSCYAAFYDINGGEIKPVTNICEMVKETFDTDKYYYESEIRKSVECIKWNASANNV